MDPTPWLLLIRQDPQLDHHHHNVYHNIEMKTHIDIHPLRQQSVVNHFLHPSFHHHRIMTPEEVHIPEDRKEKNQLVVQYVENILL